MRTVFLLFFLTILVADAMAQSRKFGDMGFFSIHRPFPENEPKAFVPVFQFDGHNMFVGKRSVRLGGIKGGVRHSDTGIAAGLGFYAFTNRLLTHQVNVPEVAGLTTVETDFGLMNLFVEPRVFSNLRWLVTAPITLGYGSIDQYYTTVLGSLRPYRKLSLTTFSLQATGEFNVFYWFSLGAGVGYHHFGTADKQVQRDYSGFVYSIKLKIDIIDLYKTVNFNLSN